MDDLNEDRLRDDMRAVAERLRAHRYEPTPLRLDELKRRALEAPGRASGSRRRQPLPGRSKLATVLLVLGLLFGGGGAGVLATHKGQPDGSPPPSAGHGQHCNSGSGNSFEMPPMDPPTPGGTRNDGSQDSPDCDPGNSPTHNRDNDREGPGTPGQLPPGPERGGGKKPSTEGTETGTPPGRGGGKPPK